MEGEKEIFDVVERPLMLFIAKFLGKSSDEIFINKKLSEMHKLIMIQVNDEEVKVGLDVADKGHILPENDDIKYMINELFSAINGVYSLLVDCDVVEEYKDALRAIMFRFDPKTFTFYPFYYNYKKAEQEKYLNIKQYLENIINKLKNGDSAVIKIDDDYFDVRAKYNETLNKLVSTVHDEEKENKLIEEKNKTLGNLPRLVIIKQ